MGRTYTLIGLTNFLRSGPLPGEPRDHNQVGVDEDLDNIVAPQGNAPPPGALDG
jgi:hypothetical protein